jgi:hypothetical protein
MSEKKMTYEDAQRFLNPDGSLNARKVRHFTSRNARRQGSKSRFQRMQGKAKPRAALYVSIRRQEILAALRKGPTIQQDTVSV